MSALIENIGLSNDNPSVTRISAHARIDYILRFSKQAILVIDESVEQNAAISGQFLASLPEQHNAAYISLSGQFNNIQIRCRIIEQLSTGELFDPEISLAVSVINFAKKSQQAISIVLDNAQHLSLQILHEISQLAIIAKKVNLQVNIVMFGSAQAGKNVADNKSLFDNKLALLSAQSGQLLSTTSALFKSTEPKWYFIKQNKWLFGVFFLLLSLTAIIINLLQQDSFNFSQSILNAKQEKISLSQVLAEPQTMVLVGQGGTSTAAIESAATSMTESVKNVGAIPEDIYLSLVTPLTDTVIKAPALAASPSDIVFAMMAESQEHLSTDSQLLAVEASLGNESGIIVERQPVEKLTVNNDYFFNSTGYVIQIAAFSDLQLPDTFLTTLASIDFHIYQRLLNNKPVVVITSNVYADKSAAQSALALLPGELLARQPWIKSVTVINSEIRTFLSAQ